MRGLIKIKGLLKAGLVAASLLGVGGTAITLGSAGLASVVHAAVVQNISVRGNTRMDSETVQSFLTIQPGKSFSNADIDDSLKALFSTGLFADVSIRQSGSTLIVEVDENATINQVFFEGNKRLKDNALSSIVQSRTRGIFSPETVSSDVSQIQEAYSRAGRSDAAVSSEIVPLANNRVNVVFRVNEGGKTKIKTISFVGNNAFNSVRLRDVMSTKRSNFMSWLTKNDVFDPDRMAADEERLRRFYFNNGYADFQILSTSAVLDEVTNEYNITITVDEGSHYTFGNISIDSTVSDVNGEDFYPVLNTRSGKRYSAKKVEESIIALSEAVAARGNPFVEVVPRGNRNFDSNTIDVTYLIDQGARTYIERIVIVGNDMTRDYVIRREFDISEGDALNQVFIQKARRRLEALGLFERVEINTRQGSAPDQAVVVVRVAEKPSGDFSIGGGYSTAGGALGEISFTEKNFMGRGQLLRISGSFGEQEESYRLSFTEPYFLGYRMSAGFDVGTTSSEDSSNNRVGSRNTFATLRLGIPLTEDSSISPFYNYSSSQTSISGSYLDAKGNNNGIQGDIKGELSAALAPPNSPTDWTRSGFGYTWRYNTLDNAITPREGVRLEVTQIAYGAGGDASYLRSEVKGQAYLTLSEEFDLVGMVRGRAGAMTLFDDNNGYRTLDNFFQGGKQIRGFASNGFGPRDPLTGDALGGMYYWNATAEMNFPMPLLPESFGIRGAVFADAGSLWGVDDNGVAAIRAANGGANPGATALGDIDGNALRASVGASVIWNSPFGPLRFDYAEPIVREKYDQIRRFSFGISTQF